MKNNKLILNLYKATEAELRKRPPVYTLRTLSMMDRQRQGLALTNNRYYITILQNHILEGTQSVVFTIEVTEDFYLIKLSCPLRDAEHRRLKASGYVPLLRSKLYLTTGLETSPYRAYAAVKLSPYSSVIDLFDSLFVLQRELEGFLRELDAD